MCKPLGNAEKAVIAALNELDPNMIVMLFTEVMIDGDCQVVKHIAETHLDAFPGELQTKVAMIGKLVDHGRKPVFGHGYSCHVCLLRPKSRGTVKLASKDPMAAPLIDPNFFGERDDMDRLIRGFKLTRKIMQQRALAEQGGKEVADHSSGIVNAGRSIGTESWSLIWISNN